MLKPTIDAAAIKAIRAELADADNQLKNQLGKDIKGYLNPLVPRIQGFIPTVSPTRGMKHEGRSSYTPARVKVSVTPGAGWGKPLALFYAEPPSGDNGAGAKISEFAGTRGNYRSGVSREYYKNGKSVRHRLNGQGRAFVQALNSSPRSAHPVKEGRYFFQGYRSVATGMLSGIEQIIDKWIQTANERLERG